MQSDVPQRHHLLAAIILAEISENQIAREISEPIRVVRNALACRTMKYAAKQRELERALRKIVQLLENRGCKFLGQCGLLYHRERSK